MSKSRTLRRKFADGPEIKLQSPTANHHESFILGNAIQCAHIIRERMVDDPEVQATSPDAPVMEYVTRCVRAAMDRCDDPPVVKDNIATGQHVVICGAGPSLVANTAEYCSKADALWGCNSALTWLVANGYHPTHGFAIDQTPEMLTEWYTAPDVEYLLASTVHVHLTEYLRQKGRRVRFFHNYVGIAKQPVEWADASGVMKRSEYEDWLYALLFPGTIRAGSGLNAVTRAIDVAICMGYETITVLGADCALNVKKPKPVGVEIGSDEHIRWLKEDVQMHADGGHALASGATMLTMEGEIDGRLWTSKPDLLISAVFLAQMHKKLKGRLRLIGDTLPVALLGKSDKFLARLPGLVGTNGKRVKLV